MLPPLTYVIGDIGRLGSTTTRLGGKQAGNSMRDGREIITVSLLPPAVSPQNLPALRSPISAKEVLGILQSAGLDPSSLWHHDPRWERLRSG